jgi:hypothetical protein
VLRAEGCGLRCELRLYRQARDGCSVAVGEIEVLRPDPARACPWSGHRAGGPVVDHYDRTFKLQLPAEQKTDLVEFLKSL